MKKSKKIFRVLILVIIILLTMASSVSAANTVDINLNGTGVETVEIMVMLTLIGLIPSLLIMTTSFTRIVIVLSFLRNAMGLQQTPPNQVIIGISIFLTLFIMQPVITQVNKEAYTPYANEDITQQQFLDKSSGILKTFMLKQTKKDDINMFLKLSKAEIATPAEDIPLTVVIPAFMTSELKRAFTIGFLLFIPFLLIDIIVSSTLMSMGMIMLPPAMISLPFKLLLFVLVDGWSLLFQTIAISFNP